MWKLVIVIVAVLCFSVVYLIMPSGPTPSTSQTTATPAETTKFNPLDHWDIDTTQHDERWEWLEERNFFVGVRLSNGVPKMQVTREWLGHPLADSSVKMAFLWAVVEWDSWCDHSGASMIIEVDGQRAAQFTSGGGVQPYKSFF